MVILISFCVFILIVYFSMCDITENKKKPGACGSEMNEAIPTCLDFQIQTYHKESDKMIAKLS